MRTTETKSGVTFFTHGDYHGHATFSVARVESQVTEEKFARDGRAYAKQDSSGLIEVVVPMSAIYELVAASLKQDLFMKLDRMDAEQLLKAICGA